MTVAKTWDKERCVYYFTCSGCKREKAQTLRRGRARQLLCRKCRKGTDENPDQMSLIDAAIAHGGSITVNGVTFDFHTEEGSVNSQPT